MKVDNKMNINLNDNLIKLLSEINQQIIQLQALSSEDFLPVSKMFKHYTENTNSNSDLSKNQPSSVEVNYMKIISKIITSLQFHDIIRQKLEHIEIMNTMLIQEMEDKKNSNNEPEYTNYIPQINLLNISQLRLINKEYQNAITNLKCLLIKLEEHIIEIPSISVDFSNYLAQAALFEKLNENVIKNLVSLSGILPQTEVNEQGLESAIMKLSKIYTMESERIVMLKTFEVNPDPNDNKNSNREEDIELF